MPASRTTLIIPAFNEAGRLSKSLPALRAHCEHRTEIDVIIVDDGSTDGTTAAARRVTAGWEAVTVLRLPWNQGKGGALKAGVAAATGERLVLMDADLSGDLADLDSLIEGLDAADIVVGSRMAAGSRAVYISSRRRTMSRMFNLVACSMTGLTASDTQCGYKALRAPVAKLLFHLTETAGFAIDVELLVLAELLGYSVSERAVGWQEVAGSRVRPLRDTRRMLVDVTRARRSAQRATRRWGRDMLAAHRDGTTPPVDLVLTPVSVAPLAVEALSAAPPRPVEVHQVIDLDARVIEQRRLEVG